MSKISITRPSSTGTNLYGSLRKHSSFVSITIHTGNGGDHIMHNSGDDSGFKSAHDSRLMRHENVYHPTRPSGSVSGQKELIGFRNVEATELSEHDRSTEVVTVHLSHEQFAELLSSTGHQIDCTIDSLRSIGKPGALYREEVKDPPDIRDRMKRRLHQTHVDALDEIDKQYKAIEEWKASEKVKESAREALRMVRQHLVANTAFAVTQAVEEMSIHAEAATTIIADKIVSLEANGRLPKGSADRFLKGDSVLGLPSS